MLQLVSFEPFFLWAGAGDLNAQETNQAFDLADTTAPSAITVHDDPDDAADEAGDTCRMGQEERDSQIVSKVNSRLAQERTLQGTHIDVSSHDGVVTLSGDVPSLFANACACEAAFSVKGVRHVKSTLTERHSH